MTRLNYQRITITNAVAPEHALPRIANIEHMLFEDRETNASCNPLPQGVGRAVLLGKGDAATLSFKKGKPGKLLEVERMKDGRLILGDHDLTPSLEKWGNCDARGCTRFEYRPGDAGPELLVSAPGRDPRPTTSSRAFGAFILGMRDILNAGMMYDPTFSTAGQLTRDIIQGGHLLMIPDGRSLSHTFSGEPR